MKSGRPGVGPLSMCRRRRESRLALGRPLARAGNAVATEGRYLLESHREGGGGVDQFLGADRVPSGRWDSPSR